MRTRPLLLDLFCGAGGCAMGYYRAGFDVVGVDIKPQPRYPFPFVQADALRPPFDLREFDAIHASPPCQKYSQVNRRQHMAGKSYPDLVRHVRAALEASGRLFVIENVEAAPLNALARLCGTAFGLPIRRHRLFESNVVLFGVECRHGRFKEKKYPTCFQMKPGERRLSTVVQIYGHTRGVEHWPAALEIDWMNREEMTQAIPPAYTEYIGKQLIAAL